MNKTKALVGISLCGLAILSISLVCNPSLFVLKLTADRGYECYGNVRIEVGDNGYEVTHIGGDATDVTIPAEINGVPVTSISADAFDDCRDTLTSITIDGSVSIEDGAFNNMTNELDVTFTGDMDTLDYGPIFESTTIGTMTIPATVTTVSPETFYGVTDTTTLNYEGSFENFWSGVFPNLWNAFNTTLGSETYTTASMPTNIIVNGTAYYVPDGTSYFGLNRDNTTYHIYYFKQGSTPSTNQITKRCSFGVNDTSYYKNDGKL